MICKKCGEELPVGAEVCPKCGAPVERRKLTPEDEARIQAAIPALKEALMLNKITSDTTLSDEERIKAAVPVLREALRRNFQQGWRCKVCGHNNPRSAVSCVKCGRNRIRTEKLTPGEYDPANMPKPEPQEEIVRYVKAEEPKQEEPKQNAQNNPQTPIVYNYVYPAGGAVYGAYSQDTIGGNTITTPYIASSKRYSKTEERQDKTVNRILALILLLLSGAFIFLLLVGFPIMTFKEAGMTKPYAVGFQLLEAAIYALSGGTLAGAGAAGGIKYTWTDAWRMPFYIDGVGLNFGRLVYVLSTVLLCVILLFAVMMFIMNIVRLATGRIKSKGKSKCHGIMLTTLILTIVLIIAIIVGGTFIPQDASRYPAQCGAIDGLSAGIGLYLAAIVALAMFIIGFFTRKVRRVNVIDNSSNDTQA